MLLLVTGSSVKNPIFASYLVAVGQERRGGGRANLDYRREAQRCNIGAAATVAGGLLCARQVCSPVFLVAFPIVVVWSLHFFREVGPRCVPK
jgi:hypothetical protein